MKRAVGFLAALVLVWGLARPCWGVELTLTSHAALLMEKTTGQILYAQNEHDALPPASVTKIMTVLLTMEAISSGRIALDDTVTVSAYAAGMGGSQVFLAEGEQITVDDLLKAVCVSSGNDAAVALAEHVGYCISATAERDGMELIAVIMKGTTSDSRNADAKTLLNYGFSTYTLVDVQPQEPLAPLPVTLGAADSVALTLPAEGHTLLVEKSRAGSLTQTVDLPESVAAPVQAGQQLGTLTVTDSGGDTLLTVPLLAAEPVAALSWGEMTTRMLQMLIFCA